MNNFLEKQAPTTIMAVEETGEIAEIKARVALARQFPRDIHNCMQNIEMECKNSKLAEIAQYSYPKGGTEVKGASIRLLEVISRHWGNMVCGIKELTRTQDGCTAKAYAWDLETNVMDEKIFDVAYIRDTKKGSYAVKEEREKYELMANFATRRKRACLQAIIPSYVVDKALEICDETLTESMSGGKEKPIETIREEMLEAFVKLVDWIAPEHLGVVIGKDFEKANKQDLLRLRKLLNAIKEGFAKPEIVFGLEAEGPELPSQEEEAAAEEIVKQMGLNNNDSNEG